MHTEVWYPAEGSILSGSLWSFGHNSCGRIASMRSCMSTIPIRSSWLSEEVNRRWVSLVCVEALVMEVSDGGDGGGSRIFVGQAMGVESM